jgi:hypothetical protein
MQLLFSLKNLQQLLNFPHSSSHTSYTSLDSSGALLRSSAWSRADRASAFPRRVAPPKARPPAAEASAADELLSSPLVAPVRKTDPARGAPAGAGTSSPPLAT